jgi:hypothetical protein
METQEKPMNEQESLQLIYQMINSTKQNLKEHAFSFLFWGYLVLATVILQYVIVFLGYDPQKSGLVWAILMPLGGIVSGVIGYKKSKKENVKTHIDTILKYLGTAFGASMCVLFFVLGKCGYGILIPHLIMMLYGFFLYVIGGLLKFRPLVLGGISCWVYSIAACFLPIEFQGILIALAVITGYIIPGHMLKASKNNN